jgi:hypothetical protein
VQLSLEDLTGSERSLPFALNTELNIPLGEQLVIGSAPHDGKHLILVLRVERAE